jgi:transposase-like protein
MQRVPPSERTSQKIRQLIAGGDEDVTSSFIRLATQQVIEQLLEAEVGDVLGRGYYQHAPAPGSDAPGAEARRGYRNGYRSGKLRSAEGAIEFAAPQVSDADQPFHSPLRAKLTGRSDELQRLATEMYARGLSTRDIEEAVRDAEGKTMLSRSAVSEATERLWSEYEAFATRDLSECEIVYLFLDGVAERLHPNKTRKRDRYAFGHDPNAIRGEFKSALAHHSKPYLSRFLVQNRTCPAFLSKIMQYGVVLSKWVIIIADSIA